jgi:hypothetical protein
MALLTVIIAANTGTTSKPALTLSLNDYGATHVYYSLKGNNDPVYELLINALGSSAEHVQDVSESLLRAGESNIQEYRTKYIIATEFNTSSSGALLLNAMYSSTAIHSAPISLNMLSNYIMIRVSEGKSTITTVNHPLPSKEVRVL